MSRSGYHRGRRMWAKKGYGGAAEDVLGTSDAVSPCARFFEIKFCRALPPSSRQHSQEPAPWSALLYLIQNTYSSDTLRTPGVGGQ